MAATRPEGPWFNHPRLLGSTGYVPPLEYGPWDPTLTSQPACRLLVRSGGRRPRAGGFVRSYPTPRIQDMDTTTPSLPLSLDLRLTLRDPETIGSLFDPSTSSVRTAKAVDALRIGTLTLDRVSRTLDVTVHGWG